MTERGETRAERRERLRRAAGEAIRHAAETDGDPLALMMAATGEQAKYCDPVLRQHPLFFELRGRFLMPEERLRKEQEERDAAAVAAEPGLVVWVRRQFDDHRHAAYGLPTWAACIGPTGVAACSTGPTDITCTAMSGATG